MNRAGRLRRTAFNGNRKPLRRTGRLRHRSKKVEQIYRKSRRQLVAAVLAEFPICQRCCKQSSTEVHEIKSRARGGSITDRRNCVALCHDCHDWITTHPAEATADGWLRNSWDTDDGEVVEDGAA